VSKKTEHCLVLGGRLHEAEGMKQGKRDLRVSKSSRLLDREREKGLKENSLYVSAAVWYLKRLSPHTFRPIMQSTA